MTAVNFSSGVYELPPAFDEPPLSPIYTEDPLPVLNEATLRRKMEEKIRDEIQREIELKLRAEIRREMEQKQRVEQELQRQLAEQKQKELEEQKELDTFHAHIRKVDILDRFGTSRISKYDTLVASGHTLLIGFARSNIPGVTMVTNKGVFIDTNGNSDICPLYTFTNPLDMKQSQMILQLSAAMWNCKLTDLLQYKPEHQDYTGPKRSGHCDMDHKKFESIIRLIPGSYSNGAWKQLDGFFGAYINEETMEIMGGAPPM